MREFNEEHHDELRMFSSVPIQNEVVNLTSEHPSSVNHFERNFQAKISPYEKGHENQEEIWTESMTKTQEFKEEHHDKLKKSPGPIQNDVLTVTSEHPSYKDDVESKLQDTTSSYNQGFKQPDT